MCLGGGDGAVSHLDLLDAMAFGGFVAQQKTLATKAAGKFYTPRAIADCLISRLLEVFDAGRDGRLRLIDPFCGDGRLIEWLVGEAATRFCGRRIDVSLWDYEEAAVGVAARRVRDVGARLGLDLHISAHVGDSFRHAPAHFGTYDIVFTNPPWDRLKPDRRETAALGKAASAYVAALREQDDFIIAQYPLSQPSLKFSGWGTNLARVGTELAFRLTAPGGSCAVVSPATLFADQVSAPLRKWMFEKYRFATIDLFPAESKLFVGVDQPVAAFVAFAEAGHAVEPIVFQHTADGKAVTNGIVRLDAGSAESMDHRLPMHGGAAAEGIFSRLRAFPRLGELEGDEARGSLWAGREIDETGFESYLVNRGKYRFIKGRLVNRYSMERSPYGFVAKNGPRIPPSADHARIVWRDVSRPTQRRRLIATIVPPGTVAGNSLNVCYYRDGHQKRLKALLGVINSFVFEFQVRANLATAHVSLGAVRKGHLPDLNSGRAASRIAALVDRCLNGDLAALDQVEVAVAKAYGMDRGELAEVLESFPRVERTTVSRLTAAALW
ncbi:MAG: hypothetical protein QOF71_3076 [Candidatus Eremiobacteraeota bacterium]|jgi:Alw26I/Eco31I/Esp3I family type II restriction m6 adenine DNA methyltransferase|nr:hypothetical protein [Candidatus Eremiobacteraeota bacterium]